MEVNFFVKPSSNPGTPGDETIIENIPLYVQEAEDYLKENPLVTEITCDIDLLGVDGSGHNQTIQVISEFVVLEPGVDFTAPNADFTVIPDNTGTAPFTVIFDASSSTDARGIASYSWDFGDNTSGSGVLTTKTYSDAGTYIVVLTVTDYYGNEDYHTETITVNEPV